MRLYETTVLLLMHMRANPGDLRVAPCASLMSPDGPAYAVPTRQGLKRARAAPAHARDMLPLRRQTSQNGLSPTAQFLSL